jgi:thiosulfate reductase cytochrome b subunit
MVRAESAYLPEVAIRGLDSLDSPRHSALVRITHGITALTFFALLVSGIMILIAHPRLYWGETGALGTPSLLDLPIPLTLGYSGWGRYLHFLSAWICVLTGVVYVLAGLLTQHLGRHLLPSKADLAWDSLSRSILDHLRLRRPTEEESRTYNVLQRLAYLAVIFIFFPLVVVTGLGMSPAIVSVVPAVATVFGGQQSARTLHFFVASFLVLFLFVHIAMVCLAGFTNCVRGMVIGYSARTTEPGAVRQSEFLPCAEGRAGPVRAGKERT